MARWNPHVADYYINVFVPPEVGCGFHGISFIGLLLSLKVLYLFLIE